LTLSVPDEVYSRNVWGTLNSIYISVILWRSVLLVEENGAPGENHRPAASHWQTLSHKSRIITQYWEYTMWIRLFIHLDCSNTWLIDWLMFNTNFSSISAIL
jgi:hypothetical protein